MNVEMPDPAGVLAIKRCASSLVKRILASLELPMN